MPTPIGVRSPRIVDVVGSLNQTAKVELYIWNSPSSIPSTPTHTLEKPIVNSITTAHFDISPYCRNYINHTTYTEVTSLTASPVGEYCFCTAKYYLDGVLGGTFEFICFDGFGYHADGQDHDTQEAFLTEGNYYVSDTGNTGGLYHTTESLTKPNGTWVAKYTGLTSGGVTNVTLTNQVGYVPYVHPSYVGQGNKLEILKDSIVQYTYNFYEVCEPKYTVINCDFVNRWGGWQRLVFFKASIDSFSMTNTEYNLMSGNIDYDVTENRRKVFNANAEERITCNTGWVFESYKEVIKELMLSETIRLDNKPVILQTKSTKLHKGINDNNINYTLEFKYAYHALNYNI